MKDRMLSELYERAFQLNRDVKILRTRDNADTELHAAYAKADLINELIDLGTQQIRDGSDK